MRSKTSLIVFSDLERGGMDPNDITQPPTNVAAANYLAVLRYAVLLRFPVNQGYP